MRVGREPLTDDGEESYMKRSMAKTIWPALALTLAWPSFMGCGVESAPDEGAAVDEVQQHLLPPCGDGVCSTEWGESSSSCPEDCGAPPSCFGWQRQLIGSSCHYSWECPVYTPSPYPPCNTMIEPTWDCLDSAPGPTAVFTWQSFRTCPGGIEYGGMTQETSCASGC